ncbi:MAG: hypothetical protein K2P78_00370 [Gemmataceae bacterium]|nr:hypothetical protein [Gemmataceae bacterium]
MTTTHLNQSVRRSRTTLRVEELEDRVNPTFTYWVGSAGGYWNEPANWSTGLVPGGGDPVSINLSPGDTVIVPANFNAGAQQLWCDASLDVEGNLDVFGGVTVTGEFDVSGSFTATNPFPYTPVAPENALTLTPVLGSGIVARAVGVRLYDGGTITGTVTTGQGVFTFFMGGEFDLLGSGTLTGAGWYSVLGSDVRLDGANQTINQLYVGVGGRVLGSADVTLTQILISQGGTFEGAAGTQVVTQDWAYFIAPWDGSPNVVDTRAFIGVAEQDVVIDGPMTFKGKTTSAFNGNTEWKSGDISVTGGSRVVNTGDFTVLGGNKVSGGVGPDGNPDGTYENSGTLAITAKNETRFENMHFENNPGAEVSVFLSLEGGNDLVFSGGTGSQKGTIEAKFDYRVVFTDGTRHVAYGGSTFTGTGLFELRDGGIMLVASGESTEFNNLVVTGGTSGGVIQTVAGAFNYGHVDVRSSLDWSWGKAIEVNIDIRPGASAKLWDGKQVGTERSILRAGLLVNGKAQVTADLDMLGDARIVVDGSGGEGILTVTAASITNSAQSPAGPLVAQSGSTVELFGGLNQNGMMVGSVGLAVVVDGSNVTGRDFDLLAGYLQVGDSKTTLDHTFRVLGHAPFNAQLSNGLRTESIYIAGGMLAVLGQDAKLVSEQDLMIKPAALFDANGTIKVGAGTDDRDVIVEGTLVIAGDDARTLAIQGNIVLSGTTKMNLLSQRNDRVTSTGYITLGGALVLIAAPDLVGTWTLFQGGELYLPNNGPRIPTVEGTFSSITAGFTPQYDPEGCVMRVTKN